MSLLNWLSLKEINVALQGTVKLQNSGANAKIWSSSTKGAGNLVVDANSTQTWDLSNSTQKQDFYNIFHNLFVEGINAGSSIIRVSYENSSGTELGSDMVHYAFLAATCGWQPDLSNRDSFKATFPDLVDCEWSITDIANSAYNCIAWSVDELNVKYNDIYSIPGDGWVGIDEVYGNANGTLEMADMDAFYLAKKGYTPTATGPEDAEIMYFSGFHAAKKIHCSDVESKWIMFESKCGSDERIEHIWNQLNGFEPDDYGAPIRFYK